MKRCRQSWLVGSCVLAGLWGALPCGAEELSLDGSWQVAEGVEAESIPSSFAHEAPVPGLTHQAVPAFPDVDHYETHEFVYTMKRYGVLPADDSCEGTGRTRQKRSFFWYAKTFQGPATREHATLVVNKAQFGTAVWLNGRKLGEHAGCFTAGRFDASAAMNWGAENRLVIRIGAHPGAMPEGAFWGSDGEKAPWTPGIYDHVTLRVAGNPVIEDVQVAPRIATGEVVVQTRVKNCGAAPRAVELTQQIRTWKGNEETGRAARTTLQLAAGEEKTVTQTVPVPEAVLWSPENPFLYVLETGTGGDTRSTRFGMREFRFDPVTRLPMLNGKVCYLRGASITLHRFFGDPACRSLPWDKAWLKRFLVEIPREMNWNCFRICIGPAPQDWLDLADEAGLLLQYEFPIWSDRPANAAGKKRHELWDEDDIAEQLREFVRDNWNHPSVAIWDASNETHWSFLREKLVPAVRGMDLSGRPWENGYEEPGEAGDPYETHPYQFIGYVFGKPPYFQMADLAQGVKEKPAPDWQRRHAAIINEYDWLWLHRDGTPTHLTRKVFDSLLGPEADPEERFALNGRLLGELTEFWRAQRKHAGVLYLAYLDGDLPPAFTCDNFRDVAKLQLEGSFAAAMREAFKPLGVCLDFWQTSVAAGAKGSYRVLLTNDTQGAVAGSLELVWRTAAGDAIGTPAEVAFEVPAVGQATCTLELPAPGTAGRYALTARAASPGQSWSPAVSKRGVSIAVESPEPAHPKAE